MRRHFVTFTLMILCLYPVYAQTEIQATWSSNATSYRGSGSRVTFACPPNGAAATVWGSNPYTDDSSVCTAAVHAGLITFASGGRVTIEVRADAGSYQGTIRNGVTTNNYGKWSGSYVFVGTASPGQPTTAGAYIDRGLKFVDDREYTKAIADFDEAIRLEPGNGYGYLNRGMAHMRNGNREQALADTNRAVEMLPSNVTAYANRSLIYSVMNNRIAAKADADKAITLGPSYGRAYLARGISVMTDNVDAALSDFEHSIQLDPSFGGTYYFRGLVRFDKKQFDLARSDFQKAVDLKADVADAAQWRDRANDEWRKQSAPPAMLPMLGDPPAPAQPVKCKSLSIHVPSKTIAPGEPAFFAAVVDGKYFTRTERYGYTWSTTAGRMSNTSDSTAVVDTSSVEAPSLLTVTVEIPDQIIPACRSASFASATIRIAAPVTADGQNIASYYAPLDETQNALILSEVKRYSQLATAGLIAEELQVRAYSGPKAVPGQNLRRLNELKQYLVRNGADITGVRFVDKGKRDSAGFELWMTPKTAAKPAARRPK